jgi:hypothetical protein
MASSFGHFAINTKNLVGISTEDTIVLIQIARQTSHILRSGVSIVCERRNAIHVRRPNTRSTVSAVRLLFNSKGMAYLGSS